MKPSQHVLDQIKLEERLSLKAYPDSGGVWTIGFGIIVYPDGGQVKDGDVITREYAEKLFNWQIGMKTSQVNTFVPETLNQNQYDALFDFAYNCGVKALEESTLLKLVKVNPDDHTAVFVKDLKDGNPIKGILVAKEITALNIIRYNFIRWSFDNGKFVEGLYRRRSREADLFLTPVQEKPIS